MAERGGLSQASYVLGIISIVFAFMQPVAGLILGVIGFKHAEKENGSIAKRAKQLNKTGIIISTILLLIYIAVMIYFKLSGIDLKSFDLTSFPK